MSRIRALDAHEAAPTSIRDLYKYYQKLPRDAVDRDAAIIDFERGLTREQQRLLHPVDHIAWSTVYTACQYLGTSVFSEHGLPQKSVLVYEVPGLPGAL